MPDCDPIMRACGDHAEPPPIGAEPVQHRLLGLDDLNMEPTGSSGQEPHISISATDHQSSHATLAGNGSDRVPAGVRSDPHSHRNLRPEDYSCVAAFDAWTRPGDPPQYLGGIPGEYPVQDPLTGNRVRHYGLNAWHAQDRLVKQRLETDGIDGNWAHRGRCDACGAGPIREVEVFLHHPTQKLVAIGGTCRDRFNTTDRSAYLELYVEGREREQRKGLAREWIAEVSDGLEEIRPGLTSQFMDLVDAHGRQGVVQDHLVTSVVGRLIRYGSVSAKQATLVGDILNRVEEIEPAPTQCAPSGRVQISGEVLGQKVVESPYGSTVKWLVRADDGGWKLWISRPSTAHALGLGRGDWVSFTATVEPSPDDPYFAFGKRPTKLATAHPPLAIDDNVINQSAS